MATIQILSRSFYIDRRLGDAMPFGRQNIVTAYQSINITLYSVTYKEKELWDLL